ncbi:MAG: DUF1800 domain-containing protein [Acidimicrobiales bacterium]
MERHEAVAHLLRRTTFGPRPGQVERLVDRDLDDVITEIVDDRGDRAEGAAAPDLDADDELVVWWLNRLRDPRAGLHERMVWYWHGHFTTSLAQVTADMMWQQHLRIRRHALGNFRDLTRELLTDAAMLVYLDGSGSRGEEPNENLARELMELFTLGVGNYTEDDVKAAARALSGYWVDWETAEVHFEAADHYDRPVRFLGERAHYDVDRVVEALLDQPACARHVAGRLHRHLVGLDAEPAQLDRLAAVFRAHDLEITPLVEAILRSDAFAGARRTRTRQPIEWLVAALPALGADDAEIDVWSLSVAGQLPFHPPNVAGWPDGDRWVDGSQVLNRINRVLDLGWQEAIDLEVEPDVDTVLARCGIWDVSPTTRAVLDDAIRRQSEYDRGLELLFALTLTSPEFALA